MTVNPSPGLSTKTKKIEGFVRVNSRNKPYFNFRRMGPVVKTKRRIRSGYAVFLSNLSIQLFSFISKVIMHKHITPSD